MPSRKFLPILLLGFNMACLGQASPAPTPTKAVSTSNAKKAEKLFQRTGRLQSAGQLSQALDTLETSRELNPAEPLYSNAEEYVRQQIVSRHLERGNNFLERNLKIEAMAEFRQAL